ncbi:BRCA2-interacting transcriptional repressor EMSY isoform X9 [Rhinopithecus roxellana]|uniref:BRCA2-interacting transcriptional repressor EMSY isoform X10 n=1 Tax=Rhinopithecus bieti TaxID=61621 RepID=UPI00083BEABD|nr:PREDICTED: BRCA2-interacting transcriptional repressor EMSY isoform X10 [Rhinopithecus bieti]XP_030773235.1 BRCA2-interacting transcriptional repressor EMSY isoform X9 [Rhinopithecus roxellana]
MPVVWPTLLDLSRDECKRILRKLELEAYAGVISALRAQGDLTKEKKDLLGELSKVLSISTERHRAEVRRAVNDERLTTIAHNMSGPNSSSEWSIEGRRLVPLMPRLVPQTAFTVTANAVANAAIQHNASLPVPAETGSKEVVVCYSYTSTTSTPTSTPVPSGSIATVKSPRPASPASNVVVLPSGSTVYVKSVSCSDEDEKPRKRRRTNSSSSSPVVLKEVPKAVVPVSKTITVPVSGSPKMSNIMQSIANSLPPHMSPVKITFTKPSTQTTNTTTQKVIIVTTSPSSTFVPNILSKSHNYAAVTKLVPTSVIASTTQKPPVVITASQSSLVSNSSSGSSSSTPSPIPNTVAVTAVVSSTPSVVMSTVAQGVSTSAIKMASTRLPSPKSLVSAPTQILAQFPKQHQQSPKQQLYQVQQQAQQQVAQPSPVTHQQQPQQSPLPPGIKPTIQIKQESGVKIITQQVQPSKILPKPVTATLPTSSNSPIMVVSSNGAIMTTKLVTTPTGTQATYTRPTVSPSIGRMAATPGAATYVKTTSGSIITVVPKSLATLGGKIISSNIVSGTTTKITTIPMTSKPNVIVVQKTTGKGTTIQGLPGKNVVTTLLNAGGEKTIQTVPTGAKPAILTATRPITKMIVTQPKGIGSTVQPAAKIIPTKIVYGQQGKTQVLIKPKPVTFQATVVSEQTRQLVTETLQQASRVAEAGNSSIQEGKEEPHNYTDSSSSSTESSQSSQDSQPVVHVIASRRQDWSEHEIAMETSPTIIYQDVSSESQSATSTIKALLELQQTTVKEKLESKPRQPTIDLSQMAVPIQMTQEKRHSPESPSIAVVESELVAEYITTVSHRSQPQQPSQPQRTLLQHVAQSQTATQTSVVVKSIPASSPGAITHIMQQALSSHTAFTKHSEELGTEEGEVEEMDTLDPQTGLFYRSALTQSQSAKQQKLSQPPLEQTQLQVKTLQCFQTKQKQTIHLQADQLQHKLPQMPQLSIRHQKLTPLQQEQAQPKPDVQHTQHPMVAKDRQLPTLMAQPPQTVVQVLAVKTTQQLPKLQQAPNQPKIYVQPQTPQSQMSLPASSEKQTASQVEQPIITQGSSVTKITFEGRQPPTVTKITGGSSVPKLTSPVTSISPIQASEKTAVSDILKMSLMEAQIDTNVEHMIVDPPKKALATSMLSGEAVSLPSTHMVVAGMANSTPQQQKCRESCSSPSTVGSSLTTRKIDAPAVPATGQFMRIQNVGQKKAEESPAEIIIQAIPQYAIPCHSSSNVVVEPSGLLELNNFTSQQLDDEETAMEQDIDSSTEDGTEPSPSQSSAERS